MLTVIQNAWHTMTDILSLGGPNIKEAGFMEFYAFHVDAALLFLFISVFCEYAGVWLDAFQQMII